MAEQRRCPMANQRRCSMAGQRPPQGRALLVLDVQDYFFDASSPAFLPGSGGILPQINGLVQHAVAAHWPIIVTTHHAPTDAGNLMSRKWRHHPQGSQSDPYFGLEMPPEAELLPKEYYSAFFRTNLADRLTGQGISTVVICGVMTHLCVDTTARHAFMLGFQPIIVEDACCSKTATYHLAAILALRHGVAEITSAEEIQSQRT
jgi:nicotinamidase-related amidase